jgi:hypothetical protein
MNAWRIHYAYYPDDTDDTAATIVVTNMHVAAQTREEAVYKVFDELTDEGVKVESFTAAYIQEGDRWLIVHPHKQMAGV